MKKLSLLILLLLATPFFKADAVFQLSATWHHQKYSLSCEVSALQTALSAVGVNVSEDELISKLDFDTTPKQNGIWGDPYSGFVGNIDGKMLVTGYGVYADPIAKLGLSYRRTEVLRNTTLNQVLAEVKAGNPVIIWGYYGDGERVSWKTPAGREIQAVDSEHTSVLVGFTGTDENIDRLILLDPVFGEQYWSIADFLFNWQSLNNSAVVVHKFPKYIKVATDPTVYEVSKDGKTKTAFKSWDEFLASGGQAYAIVVK